MKRKGLALFFALGILLVVIVLANVMLIIISSQSRLTHHQLTRIQAYYAAMGGINYALEQLRLGNWNIGENYPVNYAPGDFSPDSIIGNQAQISIIPVGQAGCQKYPSGSIACVKSSVDFTYPTP